MKIDLAKFNLPILFTVIIFSIILYSVFVRAQGLGYSNFQGDEVNTIDFLYQMDEGIDGLWHYLVSQKRGPIQYLLNILNVNLFGYINETQIRFPYLLFSVIAIFSLYKLSKKIFDPLTALLAATLMAMNGLFIAFGRITQYQSIMYCVIPFGIMFFIKGINSRNNKILLYSGLIMSFAFLTHYDTLSVVPFFVAGFVGHFIREIYTDKKELDIGVLFHQIKTNGKLLRGYLLSMLIFFSAFLLPALCYYIPFYMGQAFEEATSGYLENRLFGGGFMPRTDITTKLLTMYIPKIHLGFLLVTGIIGILLHMRFVSGIKLWKLNIHKKYARIIFGFFTLLILAATVFSFYPIKPRSSSLLVIGASIAVSALLILYNRIKWERAAAITWFLGTFSFYLYTMKDPRTHVYVSVLPLFIIAAYGISKIYRMIEAKLLKNILMALVILSFIWLSGMNWMIFVDKNPEYPWWDKDFLGQPIYRIQRVTHAKIEGVFGFNNYRGWQEVRDLYDRGCLVGTFNSNEKNSISYFYMRQDQKKLDARNLETDSDNLIVVEGPHSWVYVNRDRLPDDYVLLGQIFSNDHPVTHIYGEGSVYPDGKFLCEE